MAGPASHDSRAPAAPHPVRRRHWLCANCANEHILARGARECHLVRLAHLACSRALADTRHSPTLSPAPERVHLVPNSAARRSPGWARVSQCEHAAGKVGTGGRPRCLAKLRLALALLRECLPANSRLRVIHHAQSITGHIPPSKKRRDISHHAHTEQLTTLLLP